MKFYLLFFITDLDLYPYSGIQTQVQQLEWKRIHSEKDSTIYVYQTGSAMDLLTIKTLNVVFTSVL